MTHPDYSDFYSFFLFFFSYKNGYLSKNRKEGLFSNHINIPLFAQNNILLTLWHEIDKSILNTLMFWLDWHDKKRESKSMFYICDVRMWWQKWTA